MNGKYHWVDTHDLPLSFSLQMMFLLNRWPPTREGYGQHCECFKRSDDRWLWRFLLDTPLISSENRIICSRMIFEELTIDYPLFYFRYLLCRFGMSFGMLRTFTIINERLLSQFIKEQRSRWEFVDMTQSNLKDATDTNKSIGTLTQSLISLSNCSVSGKTSIAALPSWRTFRREMFRGKFALLL